MISVLPVHMVSVNVAPNNEQFVVPLAIGNYFSHYWWKRWLILICVSREVRRADDDILTFSPNRDRNLGCNHVRGAVTCLHKDYHLNRTISIPRPLICQGSWINAMSRLSLINFLLRRYETALACWKFAWRKSIILLIISRRAGFYLRWVKNIAPPLTPPELCLWMGLR